MEKRRFQLNPNHRPLGICEVCLSNEKLTRGSAELLVSYCIHNRSLGILEIDGDKPRAAWIILSPVTLAEANAMIEENNKIIELFIKKVEKDELERMPAEAFHQA
jgi:hypothetical protein